VGAIFGFDDSDLSGTGKPASTFPRPAVEAN
jgi:hypothetical protein